MLNQIYGLVVFLVGIGFIAIGAYLLFVVGTVGWEDMLIIGGMCLFGYLLTTTGYKMSGGGRF